MGVPDIALVGVVVGQKNAHACRIVMDCYPSTALSVHTYSFRNGFARDFFRNKLSEKLLDLVVHLCRNLCRPPPCFSCLRGWLGVHVVPNEFQDAKLFNRGEATTTKLYACITDEPWQFSGEDDRVDQNRPYGGRLKI